MVLTATGQHHRNAEYVDFTHVEGTDDFMPKLTSFALVLVLTVGATACGGSGGFDGDPTAIEGVPDDVPVVDYSSWPLASVANSLGPCATFSRTAADLLWVPTKSEAQADGYGYMSGQIALLTATEAVADQDCTVVQGRLEALSTALQLSAQRSRSSEAYEEWSDCMNAGGHSGLTTPADRRVALAKMLYETDEPEPVEAAAARAEALRADERKMALVDVACQAQTILPVESAMIADQTAVIDEAPSDQADLLRG